MSKSPILRSHLTRAQTYSQWLPKVILLGSMGLTLNSHASKAEANLLPNGDFERGQQGWKIAATEKMTTISDEQAASGKYSLRVVDESDTKGSQALSEPVSITGGRQYTVGCKFLPVSGTGLGVYVRFFGEDGKQIEKSAQPLLEAPHEPVGQWTPLARSITAPMGAVTMDLWLHSYSASKVSVYLDDVMFVEAEAPTNTEGAGGKWTFAKPVALESAARTEFQAPTATQVLAQ